MNTECVDIIKGQSNARQYNLRAGTDLFSSSERETEWGRGEGEREERREREQKGWLETVARGLLEEIPMC